ncbi:YMGG-like glycine zipper-containing protein [Desulfobulbus alkaliphilus]|uniref:YMGG-like glycine zipper-containing protein n=1 Tax=Desulfobulbus alkaliphilus TaxID=869814 RepID=UPI0019635054|nr:YMGG-like glycine zipper-containing protein [Desulfobulbus alkaliphilus]MBM9536207.1 hypothetical protein [Desulfobulbus alkaliphilus]
MNRKIVWTITLISFLALVSGCAGIQDDGDRTRSEGAATGAGIGAVTGAVLGQVFGGDTRSTVVGAAIGAALGGAGGYAYGKHVANQKEKYASEEDWLEACIAEAQRTNAAMARYNDELRQQIDGLRRDTEALEHQYADAKTRNVQLKEKKKVVDGLARSADKELTAARSELAVQNAVVSEARSSGQSDYAQSLDNQLETLKDHIRELEKQTEELAAMSAAMAV